MHNLVKSRAVFEILKKPLPECPLFYRDSESENDTEDNATDATDATVAREAAQTEAIAKLNVNASEFVPRSKGLINNNDNKDKIDTEDTEEKQLTLGELQRHFEALDERKYIEPKLVLPWKGFPKPVRPVRTFKPLRSKDHQDLNSEPGQKLMLMDKEALGPDRKKPVNEPVIINLTPAEEKRREQERKVAVEALKLVEQRRMRTQLTNDEESAEIIVHLTRTPVDFTPEERKRVERLRTVKREHIERVLRDMRKELELKQQRLQQHQPKTEVFLHSHRYICLHRATPKPEEPPADSLPTVGPPKRYIPTAKQWDERCKAKAYQTALGGGNKENNMPARIKVNSDETNAPFQRAMIASTLDNIMHPTVVKPMPVKERELFVPRYWPPAPALAAGEKRRGNLTHARNISRAFPNCGLLPTPSLYPLVSNMEEEEDSLPHYTSSGSSGIKRYGIEELLEWEPQPDKLQKPLIDEALAKLGFMCE